jgi:hypothetical protein
LPEAPFDTIAVIVVPFTTVKEADDTVPKLTRFAPVKLDPVIVISDPATALVGVNDRITGAGINVNPANVATPPGVVTLILPDAPFATTAVRVVLFTTVKEAAGTAPKLTRVAPVKLVPLIVTTIPAPAVAGVKEEIIGAGINVNPAAVAVPAGVVTLTLPELPLATTAVIVVALITVKEVAPRPPKLTMEAPVKLVPVIVTVVPDAAVEGL